MKTEFEFYGVCGNRYKLDDTVWEAIEDPGDGYRSYLGSIELVMHGEDIFFPDPIATITVEKFDEEDSNGYRLIDIKDQHIWLEIGTANTNDYYPYFVFRYEPKPPKLAWEEFYKGKKE
jgi:hypothetical protein